VAPRPRSVPHRGFVELQHSGPGSSAAENAFAIRAGRSLRDTVESFIAPDLYDNGYSTPARVQLALPSTRTQAALDWVAQAPVARASRGCETSRRCVQTPKCSKDWPVVSHQGRRTKLQTYLPYASSTKRLLPSQASERAKRHQHCRAQYEAGRP
jgi:hypothetical protein